MKKYISVALALVLFVPALASAHKGGTDRFGCHAGTLPYHCNHSSSSPKSYTPTRAKNYNFNPIKKGVKADGLYKIEKTANAPLRLFNPLDYKKDNSQLTKRTASKMSALNYRKPAYKSHSYNEEKMSFRTSRTPVLSIIQKNENGTFKVMFMGRMYDVNIQGINNLNE